MKKVLMWLILGTKGGYNRARIIQLLHDRPYNKNQLSKKLNLNYRTITHHLSIFEEMGIIETMGDNYGVVYFLSDKMLENYDYFTEIWNKLKE